MLLNFEVSGFRSFRQPAILSMVKRSMKTNVPAAGKTWGDVTERLAAIFGANAAGKTTLLDALWALVRALKEPGSSIIYQPCANGFSSDSETTYEVDFVVSGVRYVYRVRVKNWGIAHESLYSYPKASQRLLFVREQASGESEIDFIKGPSLKGPTSEVLKLTGQTKLYLGVASQYGHSVLAPVAKGLSAKSGFEKISFREGQDEDVIKRVIMEMIATPMHQTELVKAVIQAADVGIEKVDVRVKEIPEEIQQEARRILNRLREGLSSGSNNTIDIPRLSESVVFVHRGEEGKTFELPIARQSAGTLTWITIVWHVLNALKEGQTLLVDEIDASLHPELVRYVVGLFTSKELNQTGAQLIFTTHDVTLLGNSPSPILTPDQVWFVEKSQAGLSELYSLGDFDNRPGNNSAKRYLAGQFGAVPDIDDSLLREYLANSKNGGL